MARARLASTPTRDDAEEASAAQSLSAPAPCDGAARNGHPQVYGKVGIESLRSIYLPTLTRQMGTLSKGTMNWMASTCLP